MAAPIALITGSARRIGARIAETLHRKGCRVVIHYHRSEQEARQLVDAFNRERPASAACLAADLRDPVAVRDLAAILSFLATPDDDLSLATALKSPLFGWSEQDLFTLAHYRKEDHLWQALRGQTETHAATLAVLRDLRGQVDYLRPYDLIERILTRHDGRRKLLARLGPEAEDGINAMLSQALSYERGTVPSLTGFLQWMQTDDLEIKRQIDSASNQIRVMTVHGAKGLEAPIVILPDTGRRDVTIKDEIISVEGTPVWKAPADDMPQPMRARLDEMKEAALQERLRLFYVAMTLSLIHI